MKKLKLQTDDNFPGDLPIIKFFSIKDKEEAVSKALVVIFNKYEIF